MDILFAVEKIIKENNPKIMQKELNSLTDSIRKPIIEYLKENSLRILRNEIVKVYEINSFRQQIIELPRFLESVKVKETGKWAINIFVDEEELRFITESGDPIYQLSYGEYINENNDTVHNLREYFRTPINGIPEEEYYINHAVMGIREFIKTDFKVFVTKLLSKGRS